jgi:hypothetical protein
MFIVVNEETAWAEHTAFGPFAPCGAFLNFVTKRGVPQFIMSLPNHHVFSVELLRGPCLYELLVHVHMDLGEILLVVALTAGCPSPNCHKISRA